MTPLELKLLSLSKSAFKFVSESGLETPTFDPSLRPFVWPSPESFPALRVLEGTLRPQLIPNPLLRAIALRQEHDPDTLSPWVFVPVPELNQVWLVRTSTFNPADN